MSVLPFRGPTRSRSVFPIEPSRPVHGQSPEQRLMAAVLMQAVDDLRLVRGHRGRSRLARENLLDLDADRSREVGLPKLRTQ